jgi:hypothetical protein
MSSMSGSGFVEITISLNRLRRLQSPQGSWMIWQAALDEFALIAADLPRT